MNSSGINKFVGEKVENLKDAYIRAPELILGHYYNEKENSEGYHGRELLELLQNAVDALAESGNRAIRTELKGDIFTFSNNGNVFTEKGIMSIMRHNLSPKRNNSKYIGNKGLGFRSVLNWAQSVKIYSGDLSVEFSPCHAEATLGELEENHNVMEFKNDGNSDLKVATLVAPKVIPPLESKEFDTVIEITASDSKAVEDIQKQLNEITSSTLLFLEKLEKLTIVNNGIEKEYRKKAKNGKDIIIIEEYVNSEQTNAEEWFVKYYKPPEDSENKYAISIAHKEDMSNQPRLLYSYFKTEERMPFPVLIHATLDLDQSRNHLNQTDNNKMVLGKICESLVEIARTNCSKVDYSALKILAPQGELPFAWADFENTYINTISESTVFPTVNNELISFLENPKFYSKTNIAKYLAGNEFESLLAYCDNPDICKTIKKISEQKNITLRYSYDEIVKKINRVLAQLSAADRAELCVRFIDEYASEITNNSYPDFIIDSDKQVVKPNQYVFLPSTVGELPRPPSFTDTVFMNKELADALTTELKTVRATAEKLKEFNVHEYNMTELIRIVVSKFNAMVKTTGNEDGNSSMAMDRLAELIELITWLWEMSKSNLLKDSDGTKMSLSNRLQEIISGNSLFREIPKSNFLKEFDGVKIFLLNRAQEIVPANTLYLGKEYGNSTVENLYVSNNKLFVAEPAVFKIPNNEINVFAQFLMIIGVERFPRRKKEEVNEPPSGYKHMLAEDIAFPAVFESDGYFESAGDFVRRARLKKIVITAFEHYETILQKAETEYILKWLMEDNRSRELILSRYELDYFSYGEVLWGQMGRGRRIPHTSLTSYMRYKFATEKWFTINGERYSPAQCLFMSGIGDKLLPYAIEPVLDIYIEKSHQKKSEESRLRSWLLEIGAAGDYSDLTAEAIYGILLKLPEPGIDPDGRISRALYLSLVKKDSELLFLPHYNENYHKHKFERDGQVYCKSTQNFTHYSTANYMYEQMVSSETKKEFMLIDIPSKQSKEKVQRYFRVPPLDIKWEIVQDTLIYHDLNGEFEKYFACYKVFAFCYRVNIAKSSPEASLMKSLKVCLCSELSADCGRGAMSLDNGAFIRIEDTVYLKVSSVLSSISALCNDAAICAAVAEIITSLAKINYESQKQLYLALQLLFSRNDNWRQAFILQEFGSLEVLSRSKELLDTAINLREMLKDTCKGFMGELPDKVLDIIENIKLQWFNSIDNAPLLIRLLDELDIDVSDFNDHSDAALHIDLRPYFINEVGKIHQKRRERYKSTLIESLKSKPISKQKELGKKLDEYDNWKYIINNTKNINVETIFSDKWGISACCDEQTCNTVDENWKQARKSFEEGKDKSIILGLLANSEFDSLLYFGAVDELEKMYANEENDSKMKEGAEAAVLESTDNLKAPIEEIAVTVPSESLLFKASPGGTGSKTLGMKAERNNSAWGAKAEDIVYNSFKERYKNVRWVSENAKKANVNPRGIAGLGYDLTYVDDSGKIVYVEIKSTASDFVSFMITSNEIEVGKREKEQYVVALVINMENDYARRILILKDLFVFGDGEDCFTNRKFQLSASNYRLYADKVNISCTD